MKIIIIGNGKVGYTLARQLSGEDRLWQTKLFLFKVHFLFLLGGN